MHGRSSVASLLPHPLHSLAAPLSVFSFCRPLKSDCRFSPSILSQSRLVRTEGSSASRTASIRYTSALMCCRIAVPAPPQPQQTTTNWPTGRRGSANLRARQGQPAAALPQPHPQQVNTSRQEGEIRRDSVQAAAACMLLAPRAQGFCGLCCGLRACSALRCSVALLCGFARMGGSWKDAALPWSIIMHPSRRS
jgi:hypothetical protein